MQRETVAFQALDRHQRRRAQGIPTVSVLAGAPGAGVPAWLHWAEARGLPQASTREAAEAGVARAWLEALAAQRDLAADAAAFLGERAGLGPGEVARRLGGKTAFERTVLLDGLLPAGAPGPFAACRALLGREGADLNALLSAFDGEPARALEALHALVPAGAVPALLLLGTGAEWLSRAARTAARLCAAVPSRVVALAVDPAELEAALRQGESQANAMLREGLVALEAPPPGALEQRLSELGVAPGEALAGSVARLAADGVPEEVVALFAAAAAPQDEARARSHAERFLFELLESRPGTRGLFELNGPLPVEGGRALEVDLLSRSLRLAVELDGYFHFQDRDAYRRDRRKDLELQRQGYLVLRFLSEDVVSGLEQILNTLKELVSLRSAPVGTGREENA